MQGTSFSTVIDRRNMKALESTTNTLRGHSSELFVAMIGTAAFIAVAMIDDQGTTRSGHRPTTTVDTEVAKSTESPKPTMT